MVGGPGSMKDLGGQQSRFKWMMEGHSSPDTSSPENTFHKNGEVIEFVSIHTNVVFYEMWKGRLVRQTVLMGLDVKLHI